MQLASGAPRVVRCRQMLAGHGLFPGCAGWPAMKNPAGSRRGWPEPGSRDQMCVMYFVTR
ncbi:Uncharacterised protein [Bordetella pertussis]|nr:Uncharacterised protein [Bordetella pertussis]